MTKRPSWDIKCLLPENKDAYKVLKEAFIDRKHIKPLEALLGIDSTGKIRTYDLTTAPHLFTAGTTGSGVNVGLNMIYLSMMLHSLPEDVQLIVIDPTEVEFKAYNDSPFMYADVVTDVEKTVKVFEYLVEEMENRLSLFDELKVLDLETYNAKVSPDERKPYLVLIVEEIFDLMVEHGDKIEECMSRLRQKARSAGILTHINTHIPRPEVIKENLVANFSSRLVYKVDNSSQSELNLGEGGAEFLLGKGNSYIKWAEGEHLVRVQSIFLSDDEISSIIDSTVKKFPDEKYYSRIKF